MAFVPLVAGSQAYRVADGQVMVHVPAGPFLMGTNDRDRAENSRPQHAVSLSAYWIDRTEVSNAQYRLCVEAGSCSPPTDRIYLDNIVYDDYPVTYVSYQMAVAYCLWAAGETGQVIGLPTEAQWEKAAGWDPVAEAQRTFPWGDSPATPERLRYIESNLNRPSAPVGSYPTGASAYGALDMAGNVWEWVADWFDAEYYQRTGVSLDPAGPLTGDARVTRGGSWTREAHLAVTTVRNPVRPGTASNEIGFRCAMQADRPSGAGIVLTPLDLVRTYYEVLDSARDDRANDGPTLDEWIEALSDLEEALVSVNHVEATALVNQRLERLSTQRADGLVTAPLALGLENGLRWVLAQLTAPPPATVTPSASPSPTVTPTP
jgi:formylglycine-generating enzyme required for sulfatase activity